MRSKQYIQECIRPARIGDVKAIHALLQYYAREGLLLGRSISSLYDQLRDFVVYDENGIFGVCSLHICWEDLAEIRSLAVMKEKQGRGVGEALVKSCLLEAQRLGISKVFTLTYQGPFFQKLHFKEIDKRDLPHKIWSDCLHCPQFPDCDEEAFIWSADSQ
ncbi:MAG: N-acetyltransferase [Desulfobulbaceae bacterium]|nr:N-acetyltransferase [Desulfobulbaceae bacterium]